MAKYLILLNEKKKNTLTNELLEQHITHLKKLRQAGILFLCGPFKDNDGAMQILEANSYQDAHEYAASDPFIKNGYYAAFTISELIEANEDNNYLMENAQTKGNLTKA